MLFSTLFLRSPFLISRILVISVWFPHPWNSLECARYGVHNGVHSPWWPSASPRAQIQRKPSCDTPGTICLLRRCRVPLGMRPYFLLQIRCSGPVCNCQKPGVISSRSCWAPTSDWLPSLCECEKCQKQNPLQFLCLCLPHTEPCRMQTVPNPKSMSSQCLPEKPAQQHQPAGKKPPWPRSHPALGQHRLMTLEGQLKLLSLGCCSQLQQEPACEMSLQGHGSFYQLGHCTQCHLLVDKPGHHKVLSWALPGTALERPGSPGAGYQWVRHQSECKMWTKPTVINQDPILSKDTLAVETTFAVKFHYSTGFLLQ